MSSSITNSSDSEQEAIDSISNGGSPVSFATPRFSPIHLKLLEDETRATLYEAKAKLVNKTFSNPTFNPEDKHKDIVLKYTNNAAMKKASSLYRSVRVNTPIMFNKRVYFEMHFLYQVENGGICIGLSTQNMPLSNLLGTHSESIGLYSTGNLVVKNKWEIFSKPFTEGDTIGCLIYLDEKKDTITPEINYYINGQHIGQVPECFNLVFPKTDIYPTLSIYSKNTTVIGHFIISDFLFTENIPQDTISLNGENIKTSNNYFPSIDYYNNTLYQYGLDNSDDC